MSAVKRLIIIVGCFFAAVACYMYGVPAGGAIFLVAGLIFEGLFWIGIFGPPKKKRRNHASKPKSETP
ncbi:hypothetical protein QWI17_06410 [Gilvimarinus sp. SDUM040013]|uniref:Transmembrane protein n=1 Tax=Gilvimarinus gilvus TaxID=3058038 RepID=A0ABU4S1Q5_9GAMM|nr:hypothetical protein [Gilvimarinus sp. SDUM040013]MDO3385471.1 hypothetical protein [Gilvimarinus sp. SDUM040013]MDX6851112.1 hypothetical protein [Gilvimarinus sp. SDUM040013]